MMDITRKYFMFPVRLGIVLVGFLMSLVMIATGKSWQEEWREMNLRAYLFDGKTGTQQAFDALATIPDPPRARKIVAIHSLI